MALHDEQMMRLSGTKNAPFSAQEQLQLQATILENITESVIVTDLTGAITYWNKGAQALLVILRKKYSGKRPPSCIQTETSTNWPRTCNRFSTVRIMSVSGRDGARMQRRFGLRSKRPCYAIQPQRWLDFLEWHRISPLVKRRKKSAEDWPLLWSPLTMRLSSKTLDGIITSWNTAAERLFGYSAGEAIGKHITLIIPTELYHEEEEIIGKLRQGIRIQHYETVRLRKDGTRIEVSLSISPVKGDSGSNTFLLLLVSCLLPLPPGWLWWRGSDWSQQKAVLPQCGQLSEDCWRQFCVGIVLLPTPLLLACARAVRSWRPDSSSPHPRSVATTKTEHAAFALCLIF